VPYDGRVHYDGAVFLGVGGIPFFLADYYRLTGEARALELAVGAARWCSAPDRTFSGDAWTPEALCFGRAGIGLAWVRLWEVTGDRECLDRARRFGERLLATAPGPVTDFIGGVAGEGIFLLRLWAAAREERFLAGALRRAAWLDDHAVREAQGCYWPYSVGSRPSRTLLGFAHGISGIGHSFLRVHQATGEPRWAAVAREVADTLTRQAEPDRGGLNWRHFLDRRRGDRSGMCQWCHGSPGVGLFYATAYEALGDAAYLTTAEAAGNATFAYGDVRQNPSQCHGLAGNAELLVELYRLTRNPLWLERAHDFARRALGYRKSTPEGDVWPGDDPLSTSPDFLCGASGTGHFFLRLLDPDGVRMPLL
jgi:lantibiotic modifying enzyme